VSLDSARNTVLRLFRAPLAVPLMIPGALDVRVRNPIGEKTAANPLPPVLRSAQGAPYDRERAEHELEGGGAPSQRLADGHKTLMSKIGRALRRRR
jgi:hypothetical protein